MRKVKDNCETFKKKSNTIQHVLSLANVCRQINKYVVIKDSSRHIEFLKMLITTI